MTICIVPLEIFTRYHCCAFFCCVYIRIHAALCDHYGLCHCHFAPVPAKSFRRAWVSQHVIDTNNTMCHTFDTYRTYLTTMPTNSSQCDSLLVSRISRFMGPTRGPSGADWTQVGPMLAPWTLLSGLLASGRMTLSLKLLYAHRQSIFSSTCDVKYTIDTQMQELLLHAILWENNKSTDCYILWPYSSCIIPSDNTCYYNH